MKLFSNKINAEAKIRVISQGNYYSGGKTFYVLYAPTVEDITEANLTILFGSNYASKILGGSAIYTDDLSVQIWNEEDEEFK